MLGHRTLQMVKRYAHLSDQHTGAVIERMSIRLLMNQEDIDKQAGLFPSPYKELFLYLRPIAHQALALVLLTFLACWGYAINEYGWFLGVAFGWIPSAVIAAMLGGLCWWAFVYIPWNSPTLLFVSIGVGIIVQLASFAIVMGVILWLGIRIWSLFH